MGGAFALARRTGASSEATVAAARRHGLTVSVLAPVAGIVAVILLVGAGADVGHGWPGTVGDAIAMARSPTPSRTRSCWCSASSPGRGRPGWCDGRGWCPAGSPTSLPRQLTRVAAAGTAVLVAVLAAGAALADATGHAITHRKGLYTRSASPMARVALRRAGHRRTGPAGPARRLALWVVVNRPAVATEDERIEDALRRTSAHRVLRVAGAGVLLMTGALLGLIGNQLGSVHALPWIAATRSSCSATSGWWPGSVVLCLPAPRLPVEAPAVQAA